MNVRERILLKPFKVAKTKISTTLFATSIAANKRKKRSHLTDGNTTYSIIEEVEPDRAS